MTGAESLGYAEVAAIMTEVLRRPIRYTAPGLPAYLWQASRRLGLPAELVVATSVVYTTGRLGLAARLSDPARAGRSSGRPSIQPRGQL